MENLIPFFNNILDFIIIYIENYLVISILNLFFSVKREINIIVTILFSVTSIIVTTCVYPPIYASFMLLLMLYIYTYINLDGKRINKYIFPLLVFANLFIINTSISFIAFLFNIDFSQFISVTSSLYLIISCFQKIILFIEYIILKKYRKNELYISKQTWLLCLCLIAISIVLPEIILTQFMVGSLENSILVVFSLLQCLIINLLIYKVLINLNKEHQIILEQEILIDTKKYQEKFIEMIETKTKEMNRLSHDLNNHKIVLKNMIKDKENKQISSYMNELFPSQSYVYTKNQVLNYLLNEKINIAKLEGIDVKCLIQGDLSNTISKVDLCIILGNLLDNAIEGTKNISDKHIYVNILQDSHKLVITISNTYDNIIQEKNGYIFTKKKDHNSHGYGLSNIKLICKKYNGYDYMKHDTNIFSHTCILILK